MPSHILYSKVRHFQKTKSEAGGAVWSQDRPFLPQASRQSNIPLHQSSPDRCGYWLQFPSCSGFSTQGRMEERGLHQHWPPRSEGRDNTRFPLSMGQPSKTQPPKLLEGNRNTSLDLALLKVQQQSTFFSASHCKPRPLKWKVWKPARRGGISQRLRKPPFSSRTYLP